MILTERERSSPILGHRPPVRNGGGLATTAIEGNTLTEDQVAGILHGTFRAPPSRAYQEREVKNVLDALMAIDRQVMSGDLPAITAELFSDYNRQVLDGTQYEHHVVPGKVRDYSVGVGGYRGAPPEDCEHLVERLAHWLEGDTFRSDDPQERPAGTHPQARRPLRQDRASHAQPRPQPAQRRWARRQETPRLAIQRHRHQSLPPTDGLGRGNAIDPHAVLPAAGGEAGLL